MQSSPGFDATGLSPRAQGEEAAQLSPGFPSPSPPALQCLRGLRRGKFSNLSLASPISYLVNRHLPLSTPLRLQLCGFHHDGEASRPSRDFLLRCLRHGGGGETHSRKGRVSPLPIGCGLQKAAGCAKLLNPGPGVPKLEEAGKLNYLRRRRLGVFVAVGPPPLLWAMLWRKRKLFPSTGPEAIATLPLSSHPNVSRVKLMNWYGDSQLVVCIRFTWLSHPCIISSFSFSPTEFCSQDWLTYSEMSNKMPRVSLRSDVKGAISLSR